MLKNTLDRATARVRKDDDGFTLIELLVVITILGILAAVVVFSVSGIGDKGQDSACKTDTSTLRTAEEAYYAVPVAKGGGGGTYADAATLKSKGFLSTLPNASYHAVTVTTDKSSYTITNGASCSDA